MSYQVTTPILNPYLQKIDLTIEQFTLISPDQVLNSHNLISHDYLPINTRKNTDECIKEIRKILEGKPGYNEQLVYKLVQLNYINNESDVLLVSNSYDLRLTPQILSKVVKVLKN